MVVSMLYRNLVMRMNTKENLNLFSAEEMVEEINILLPVCMSGLRNRKIFQALIRALSSAVCNRMNLVVRQMQKSQ